MDIVSIIIQLVVGALGGNAAGAAMKDKSLGGPGIQLLARSAVWFLARLSNG